MKIFYFGELIADTKIETNVNEDYIKQQIDLLVDGEPTVIETNTEEENVYHPNFGLNIIQGLSV